MDDRRAEVNGAREPAETQSPEPPLTGGVVLRWVFKRVGAFAFGVAVFVLATWVPVLAAYLAFPHLPQLARDHIIQESPWWRLLVYGSAAIVGQLLRHWLVRWGLVTTAWGITAAAMVLLVLLGGPEVYRAWGLHRQFGLEPFGL